MTPEEAIALLKNPQVIQQLIELTRDPNLVKRLTEIAGGETVSQQAVDLLRNPEIARELSALAQRTDFYHQIIGLLHTTAIWLSIPLAISAITLLVVLYNTILLRRIARRGEGE